MKLVAFNQHIGKLRVCDFGFIGISCAAEAGVHFKTRLSANRGEQVDDDFQCFEWHTLPVAGDMAEEPVLYFVPLAGYRRKVANFEYQPRYISQPLKFKTPESCSRAVAAATIGRDEKTSFTRVCRRERVCSPGEALAPNS